MQQLSRTKSVLYHLYPGIIIVVCFIALTPVVIKHHYPPQLSFLITIILVAVPLLIRHLLWTKKERTEQKLLGVERL